MTISDMTKITINLVLFYLIGGLILAGVYGVTSPIKYKKEKEEKEAALKTMMPEADVIEKVGDWEPHEKHAEYYAAKKCEMEEIKQIKDDKTGEIKETKECIGGKDIGYVVEGYGKGYSSYINVFVSVDKAFAIKKVNVLHHAETPGLGDEIERAYFLDQFVGKGLNNLIVIKGETEDKIQAISGATISSRAVTEDGVKNSLKMLMEKFSGEVKG